MLLASITRGRSSHHVFSAMVSALISVPVLPGTPLTRSDREPVDLRCVLIPL